MVTAAATAEARTWLGLAAVARRIDGSKISDKTSAIASTVVVQTRIVGYGNDRDSGKRRELGVTIAAKRQQRDNSNFESDGVSTSLAWIGSSVWE